VSDDFPLGTIPAACANSFASRPSFVREHDGADVSRSRQSPSRRSRGCGGLGRWPRTVPRGPSRGQAISAEHGTGFQARFALVWKASSRREPSRRAGFLPPRSRRIRMPARRTRQTGRPSRNRCRLPIRSRPRGRVRATRLGFARSPPARKGAPRAARPRQEWSRALTAFARRAMPAPRKEDSPVAASISLLWNFPFAVRRRRLSSLPAFPRLARASTIHTFPSTSAPSFARRRLPCFSQGGVPILPRRRTRRLVIRRLSRGRLCRREYA
jgi:hypothetical protein